jgi:excisionase family DNA binding protein
LKLVSSAKACEVLGIHEVTLRRWRQQGHIEAVRAGVAGKWRYDVDGLIERQRARLSARRASDSKA